MNEPAFKKSLFFEYKIYNDSLNKVFLFSSNKIINTINAYSFVKANSDSDFQNALTSSDVLVCDGSGIEFAHRILSKTSIARITGYDLFEQGLKIANETKKNKVFLFGSSLENLKEIKAKIANYYPNINCKYLSPAYKDEFSEEENRKYLETINSFSPDFLFVSLTAPKQEKWVDKFKNDIEASHIASVGAVFDFYSGRIKRAPYLFRAVGIEWLFRSLKEPSRLGIRNLYAIPSFFALILRRIFLK